MARNLNVILQRDVPKLGKGGDVVKVSPGFARNYLIPQQIALPASEANVARFEHLKKVAVEKAAKTRASFQALADKLKTVEITIAKSVGAEGKLYGSVTPKDIEAALKSKGYGDIDRKKFTVDTIRQTGTYEVTARLAPEITAAFKVHVVPEADGTPAKS